jgi:hypothetical protein
MKKNCLCFLFVLIPGFFLFSQNKEPHWLPDEPGKWNYNPEFDNNMPNYKLSAAELATYHSKIDRIVEMFHQNPVLSNPVGFAPSVHLRTWVGEKISYAAPVLDKAIVGSAINIQFCPLFLDDAGAVKKACMEVSCCEVRINNPKSTTERYLPVPGGRTNEEMFKAALRLNKIFIKPLVIKELAEGVTAFNSRIIVISNPNRPYWIPVTAGELFDLHLNYYELEYKFKKDEGVLYVIDAIKKEKAAFSSEELGKPAHFKNSNISQIGLDENEGIYMRFNPEYFDKTRPRTDIQLITLYTATEAYQNFESSPSFSYKKQYQFVKALDVNMLKSLLDVK